MRDTRLKIAKEQYALGNLEHIYVQEFIDELEAKPKPKPKPKVKKEMKKYGK